MKRGIDTPRWMALLLTVALCASVRAAAAACAPPLQSEGRVAAVIDGRTLRLDDGSEIRLSAVEIPPQASAAEGALASLTIGRAVRLLGDSDAPDRYGRQHAYVVVDGDDTPVQSRLVAMGAALARGDTTDKQCAAELAGAERHARRSKHGIWVDNHVIKNTESPGDILADMGRFTLVEGRVWSVRQTGATTYLNFGRRWTQDFAATISRRTAAAFEQAGITPKSLERRRVRVRGWVERRIGPGNGPRIEVTHVGQVEVVGDD